MQSLHCVSNCDCGLSSGSGVDVINPNCSVSDGYHRDYVIFISVFYLRQTIKNYNEPFHRYVAGKLNVLQRNYSGYVIQDDVGGVKSNVLSVIVNDCVRVVTKVVDGNVVEMGDKN